MYQAVLSESTLFCSLLNNSTTFGTASLGSVFSALCKYLYDCSFRKKYVDPISPDSKKLIFDQNQEKNLIKIK
ncbi:hypothetical protein BpHYR1_036236 [Brachionus plicatilis]|uniref:Uncharacterized protein n=1 Tax=Brachionus plicatilis TaxID=10195 RepID=A0A3M7QVJ0_BRAPC|nr:hypothetical protein BpHYR1_036236 [Brachionus plicatilis]